MKKIIWGVLLFLLAVTATAQEDAATVIRFIQERTQTIQSYQANFILKIQGPGGEMLMKGNILFKRDNKIKLEMAMPNIPNAKQLTISDGNTMWQYVPYLKLASKVDLAALKKEFGDTYFTQAKEDISKPLKEVEEGSINYLGREKIDDKEHFVLEAKPKLEVQKEIPFSRAKVWIDTETALEKKTVFYDADGKEVFSRIYEEVKTNIETADTEFNFSPPEGVEVMDMTPETRRLIEAERTGMEKANSLSLPAELPGPTR